MANETQVEILRRGVKEWNRWREQNPQVDVDLSGANLTGMDLCGADLRGADLTEADLTSANLAGADLGGALPFHALLEITRQLTVFEYERGSLARLSGTRLTRTNLQGARVTKRQLMDAKLFECLVSADLAASFSSASLSSPLAPARVVLTRRDRSSFVISTRHPATRNRDSESKLTLHIDPGHATARNIAYLLMSLSRLHQKTGGAGLKVRTVRTINSTGVGGGSRRVSPDSSDDDQDSAGLGLGA